MRAGLRCARTVQQPGRDCPEAEEVPDFYVANECGCAPSVGGRQLVRERRFVLRCPHKTVITCLLPDRQPAASEKSASALNSSLTVFGSLLGLLTLLPRFQTFCLKAEPA